MGYCPKCGRRIYDEEKGCVHCGIVIDWALINGMSVKNSEKQEDKNGTSFDSKREVMIQEKTPKIFL